MAQLGWPADIVACSSQGGRKKDEQLEDAVLASS